MSFLMVLNRHNVYHFPQGNLGNGSSYNLINDTVMNII